MILSLYIKNFALIDELDVEFEQGLNILTGQTGAGKSIIIGALKMILGERADTDVIRKGTSKSIAEACIRIGEQERIRQILEEHAVEYCHDMILRREIRSSGSRAFINDTPVRIGVLKSIGAWLVDLHGQHDHQSLLNDENHRKFLDDLEQVQPFQKQYKKQYNCVASLKKELQNLKEREAVLRERKDLHQFQLQELEQANLSAEEDEDLASEMKLLDHAEELDQNAAIVVNLGQEDEASLLHLLNTIKIQLEDISRIEPDFQSYLQEINTARISIQEAIRFTEQYRSRIEVNPRRLEQLRQRQAELNKLQKKYSRSIPDLIEYQQEIRRELSLVENFDAEIEQLEKQITQETDHLKKASIDLHEARQKAGEEFSTRINDKLQHLGISSPDFQVCVRWKHHPKGWFELDGEPVECTENGADDLQFLISTNRGEEPKPLARIASGGEISRVMLSIKSIMASEQQLPVMIFDEIDTGISGQISEKVGISMRKLADRCQIIAITHQPQIASQAHKHYRVEKMEAGDRTVTRIVPLSQDEHIREVAGLMSGETISASAIHNARELIEKNHD